MPDESVKREGESETSFGIPPSSIHLSVRTMKRESRLLLAKALDSLILSIETFNGAYDRSAEEHWAEWKSKRRHT